MSEFTRVAGVDEIPTGTMKSFFIGPRRIVVYHTGRGFFATDNTCPHRGGPLAEGDLMGDEVVCPWHLWSFSLETGKNDRFPEVAVCTHEVRIEGDDILVRVKEEVQQS